MGEVPLYSVVGGGGVVWGVLGSGYWVVGFGVLEVWGIEELGFWDLGLGLRT